MNSDKIGWKSILLLQFTVRYKILLTIAITITFTDSVYVMINYLNGAAITNNNKLGGKSFF